MSPLNKIKIHLAELVNAKTKDDFVKPGDFIYPQNSQFGDLSLACFNIAKELKINPVEAAKILAEKIVATKTVNEAKAVGPYLNFTLNKPEFAETTLKEISKEKNNYGANKNGEGKRVMVEFSNANTHKEYHVGHLRNLCFGDSINRLLSANGFKSVPVSYINDFGIHVAKTIWEYKKKGNTQAVPKNKGFFLGKTYARAAEELKDNPEGEKEVKEIMKGIESRRGADFSLWKKTRQWSCAQFARIYKELGVEFVHTFYENEFLEKGKKLVAELTEKGVLKKSQGAIIADLENLGLGVLVIIRSDGTATYPVADLPLALAKVKKYRLEKSIYVVDVRQSLYFKQLFHILKILGVKKELVHLGYEFVKLPSGMMSSRSGRVVTYEELKEMLLEKSLAETKKRHEDWSEKKIADTAWKISAGAIKFEMSKVSAASVITFDTKEALRFEGFTAAYIQYTFARIESIFRKAKTLSVKKIKADLKNLSHPKEHAIILKLAKYPEIIKKAGANYDPAEIAKYLFELAQAINDYYHDVPVLKADPKDRAARLVLLKSANQVIKNGLYILGIETLEEM